MNLKVRGTADKLRLQMYGHELVRYYTAYSGTLSNFSRVLPFVGLTSQENQVQLKNKVNSI
jgi:hypothetical protein